MKLEKIEMYRQKLPCLKEFGLKEMLALLLGIWVFLPSHLFSLPQYGLDPSWQIAMNLAFESSWTFGQDIVFTYGPLAFLATKNILGVNPFLVAAFSLAVWFLFVYAVWIVIQQERGKKGIWFIILFFCLFNLFGLDSTLLYFYLILFYLFYSVQKNKLYYLIIPFTLSILIFFIKMNTGLVSSALFYVFTLYAIFFGKKKRIFAVALLILQPIGIWAGAQWLNVALKSYILNSLVIIGGYNEAMFLVPASNVLFYFILIAILLFYIVFKHFKLLIFNNLKHLMIFGTTAFALFVLYKQSFVRADEHTGIIFTFLILYLSLAYVFIDNERFRTTMRQLFPALFFLSAIGLATVMHNTNLFAHLSKLPLKGIHYLSGTEEKLEDYRQRLQSGSGIPATYIHAIGNKTVDIIPWDVSEIYFNNLTYNPRPAFQTFQAYNYHLDSINADKYISATAPDFLLFQNKMIDARHPFWEESMTKRAMTTHYQVAQHSDSNLILLERRPTPLTLETLRTSTIEGNFSDAIPIPDSDQLVYLYADIQYSIPGRLRSLFFQPPKVVVVIKYTDGSETRHKVILPIMKTGVLVNRKVTTTAEALTYFKYQGENNVKTESIHFQLRNSPAWFQPTFKVRIEEKQIMQ